MVYRGSFKDYDNSSEYRVTIRTLNDTSNPNTDNIIDPTETAPFGYDRIYFSPDPVHLTCERTDLTQLIMITQCQIKLKVNQDLSDILFADTDRDISVTIERKVTVEGQTQYWKIFYGYIDPLQFQQGFAHNFEEITINATDPLGALEELRIDQIDAEQGDTIPFMNMIYKIMDAVFFGDDTTGIYSGIQSYMNTNINPNNIKVSNSVFYGDGQNEDDWMNLYDVLNELLKYLGCTLFYEPRSGKVIMYNLYNGIPVSPTQKEWFDAKDDAMNASGSLSKDDAYKMVKLTCEIDPEEEEIKLLDDEFMYSDYTNYQKYMTELVALGNGDSAYNGFRDLMNTETTEYNGGHKLDHYCYVKRNDAWKFGSNSYITAMGGTEDEDATDNERKMNDDQSNVLVWLKEHSGKGAFVSFGKGNKINYKDNSPVNNIPMTDYLVISINGHNDHGRNGHINTLIGDLQNSSPVCTYTGLQSVNLVPTDANVTNYVVISGKIILNPLQRKTGANWEEDVNFPQDWHDDPGTMKMLYNTSTNTYSDTLMLLDRYIDGAGIMPYLWHRTVPYPDNGDGAYYQQKWWVCANKDPRNPVYQETSSYGIVGYLDNKENEMLKYSWTSWGNEDDKVSKLPVLACQLKIGDKYCVEMLNLGEQGQGVFQWMTYDEWRTYNVDGKSFISQGFDRPYFTIGIDPKVDDKIIGHSYSIQNNISYTMNVDATGTAIPVKITDKLNGVPEFTIIGPINQMWNEIERVHPTMFRHTSWNDHYFWTLEFLDSILISDLKIEMKSNNALINEDMTSADNDLVYVSDTNFLYNSSLECDLKICTPLTMDECMEMGIKYQISNSYVMYIDDNPFYGWGSGETKIKPEHLFIDYFYKQYKQPATKIDFCVDNGWVFGSPTADTTSYVGFSSILGQYAIHMQYPGLYDYSLPFVNNAPQLKTADYYCMSMDWSLKYRENTMTAREILEYSDPFS